MMATDTVGTFPSEAVLWSPGEDGAVVCRLCPHRCVVPSGQAGVCGVRENQNGRFYAVNYGRPTAQSVEPVEKKPLYHFHPGSLTYSLGTHGCNLRCAFCINAAVSQTNGAGAEPEWVSPEEVVAAALAAGCRSIAFTFVEPTIFFEYLLDIAVTARPAGLQVVLKTNGFITPEALDLLVPWVDAANVDLKAFRDESYHAMGGRLGPVLDCLRRFRRDGVWLEVTTVVIPGLNDGTPELTDLTGFISRELGAGTPWHVARFFPAYQMTAVPPTPPGALTRARQIGHAARLEHVYLSNDLRAGGQDTRCGACGETLVRRHAGRVARTVGTEGECPACGTRCPGRGWNDAPGIP